MTTTNVLRPYALLFQSAVPTALVNFDDVGWSPGYNEDFIVPTNAVAPQFFGTIGAAPTFPFTSRQIKEILAATTSETICADLSTSNNVILKYRYGKAVGVGFDTDGLSMTVTDSAMLSWSSIRARQGQCATITGLFEAIYNGTNAPLVAAIGAVSQTYTAEYFYTLGPISTSIPIAVNEWSFDVNPKFQRETSEGDCWTTWAGIESVRPTLTIRTTDPGDWIDGSGIDPVADAVTWYLRRIEDSTLHCYADNTANHIKFVAAAAQVAVLGTDSQGVTTIRFALKALPTISVGIQIT